MPALDLSGTAPKLKRTVARIPEPRRDALLLAAILCVFIAANKLAYRSYFSDDDFSNLMTARFMPWPQVPKAIFSLVLELNVRPFGLFVYKVLGSLARLQFAVYVTVLQALHLATAFMLWMFLRRLGARSGSAALGVFFFALHMSTLPAYWKPMYLFDVLCGAWAIAAVLLYQRGRFFLSLLCAWLSFRSKEMELMLPVFLLLYEWLFGARPLRWKPLIPFFLVSASFGIQALLLPKEAASPYTPQVTFQALGTGLLFYAQKLLYAPLSGLTISIGLLFLGSRLVTFGVLGFWILIAPMLLFPGRESGAYLYVPLLAFAVAIAGLAEWNPWWAALLFAIWIPASYEQFRIERSPVLALRHQVQPYVASVVAALNSRPKPLAILFDGAPLDFSIWGQLSLFPVLLDDYYLPVFHVRQSEAAGLLRRPGTLILTWDRTGQRMLTDTAPGAGHEASFVDFGKTNPAWQLGPGWFGLDRKCRWMAAQARIALRQPQSDRTFSMQVNLVPGQAESAPRTLTVSSAEGLLGEARFDKGGTQTVNWPVSAAAESVKTFELRVAPPYRLAGEGEPMGLQVCQCGIE